nr:uncharacterized protein LOC109174421 [Ipomoea batatas]
MSTAKSKRKTSVRYTMLLADFELDAGRRSQVAHLDHGGGEIGEESAGVVPVSPHGGGCGPSKGRRSTVQASERQIEGNNKYGTHKQHTDNGVKNLSQTRRELQTKNVPNRAAAENEHTLVMGDRSGASSSQVVCLDDKERSELLSLEDLYNPEHHGDPPATEVDDGTTVADDESFMDSFEP